MRPLCIITLKPALRMYGLSQHPPARVNGYSVLVSYYDCPLRSWLIPSFCACFYYYFCPLVRAPHSNVPVRSSLVTTSALLLHGPSLPRERRNEQLRCASLFHLTGGCSRANRTQLTRNDDAGTSPFPLPHSAIVHAQRAPVSGFLDTQPSPFVYPHQPGIPASTTPTASAESTPQDRKSTRLNSSHRP